MRRHIRDLVDGLTACAKTRRKAALDAAPFIPPAPAFLRDDLEDGDAVDDLFLDSDGVRQASDEPRPILGLEGYNKKLEEEWAAKELAAAARGPGPPLSEAIGIPAEEFPPSEALDAGEVDVLTDALIDLLHYYGYHFEPVPNPRVPASFHYDHIRALLPESYTLSPQGYIYHGCSYWAPGCDYGPYYRCLHTWTRQDYEDQGGTVGLPAEEFATQRFWVDGGDDDDDGSDGDYPAHDVDDLPF